MPLTNHILPDSKKGLDDGLPLLRIIVCAFNQEDNAIPTHERIIAHTMTNATQRSPLPW